MSRAIVRLVWHTCSGSLLCFTSPPVFILFVNTNSSPELDVSSLASTLFTLAWCSEGFSLTSFVVWCHQVWFYLHNKSGSDLYFDKIGISFHMPGSCSFPYMFIRTIWTLLFSVITVPLLDHNHHLVSSIYTSIVMIHFISTFWNAVNPFNTICLSFCQFHKLSQQYDFL